MTTPNREPRSGGSPFWITVNGRVLPLGTGVLPPDFPQRLVRLKEASGLTWTTFARAIGVDPKQVRRWRNGAEPCGGAMLSLACFATWVTGSLAILTGEAFQPALWPTAG